MVKVRVMLVMGLDLEFGLRDSTVYCSDD